MSIARLLAALTAALCLGGATRDPGDSRTRIAIAARHQSADTFPTFDRVVQLERTSEASANVSIGDVDGDKKLAQGSGSFATTKVSRNSRAHGDASSFPAASG